MPPITQPRSHLCNKTGCTIKVIGLQQPMHLTSTEIELLGSLDDAQAVVTDLLNDFEAMQFSSTIKKDMTTPTAHGLDQARSRHPCFRRWH